MTVSSTPMVHIKLFGVLQVRHALTGQAVPGLRATLIPPTPWWVNARTTPHGDVVVSTSLPYPASPVDPHLRLVVDDPAVAARLAQPSVEVTLDSPAKTYEFAPADQKLTVAITVRPSGAPLRNATVKAVPRSGAAAVDLPETTRPGTYQSPDRPWTRTELLFDVEVEVGGLSRVVGTYRLDPWQRDTQIHVVTTA